MLSRSALPLSRALPAATRLVVMQAASYPPQRNFHISPYSHQLESKATDSAAASDKSSSIGIPPSPSSAAPQGKKPPGQAVTVPNAETHLEDVQQRRDFFWTHPVFHRDSYNKIRVSLTSYDFLIVQIGHHEANSFREYVALGSVKFLRSIFDWLTGYKHSPGAHSSDISMF